METMTCTTEGCTGATAPIVVDMSPLDLETGEPLTVGTVYCGACSQPMTVIGSA